MRHPGGHPHPGDHLAPDVQTQVRGAPTERGGASCDDAPERRDGVLPGPAGTQRGPDRRLDNESLSSTKLTLPPGLHHRRAVFYDPVRPPFLLLYKATHRPAGPSPPSRLTSIITSHFLMDLRSLSSAPPANAVGLSAGSGTVSQASTMRFASFVGNMGGALHGEREPGERSDGATMGVGGTEQERACWADADVRASGSGSEVESTDGVRHGGLSQAGSARVGGSESAIFSIENTLSGGLTD
ncbi:hypothetical protein CERSUDRAFT_127438 [Gelatoporia subvermispora B]|uniref:Uncharacterized protein n=1 Tax=Ceriporiopsis subvermispora (strain B) TaxID=914234 RepID=M2QHB9_CERS8|nr:hypothetical protein CERSUDRAFT_127438 [Gelatoporia subvermispora B]